MDQQETSKYITLVKHAPCNNITYFIAKTNPWLMSIITFIRKDNFYIQLDIQVQVFPSTKKISTILKAK